MRIRNVDVNKTLLVELRLHRTVRHFQRAVDYYTRGEGNGAIGKYFNKFGECQESGRDQGHTQMGLGYLGCAAEIAWKQGVDLYGALDNRLALGFEYTAKYNLGHEVPYEPYRSHEGRYYYPKISDKSRGRFSSIYERVYHHYHDRMGMEMPFTFQVIEKIPPGAMAEFPRFVGYADARGAARQLTESPRSAEMRRDPSRQIRGAILCVHDL